MGMPSKPWQAAQLVWYISLASSILAMSSSVIPAIGRQYLALPDDGDQQKRHDRRNQFAICTHYSRPRPVNRPIPRVHRIHLRSRRIRFFPLSSTSRPVHRYRPSDLTSCPMSIRFSSRRDELLKSCILRSAAAASFPSSLENLNISSRNPCSRFRRVVLAGKLVQCCPANTRVFVFQRAA